MSDQALSEQFKEFQEKFHQELVKNSISFILTTNQIEDHLGFKVKEIRTYIPKQSIAEEMNKYCGNKLCDPFIIGSAFPCVEGWRIFNNKETRYVATGFSKENSIFVFNYTETSGTLDLEKIDDLDLVLDDVHYIFIEYQTEIAEILSGDRNVIKS